MTRRGLPPALVKISERLGRLYDERAIECFERMQMLIGRYGLDIAESFDDGTPDERDVVLITYGNTISKQGERPLTTLRRFLEEHLWDAVSTVHVLPFFPYSSDDGFSVIDYRQVDPELGTWTDIRAIAQRFDLMVDLVLNHCSSRSAWFRDFVAGVAPARDYFITVEPGTDLSTVVRPRATPLLTRANTPRGERFVWTTFSSDQIDLDFRNPDVLFEFIDIAFRYIIAGATIIRLDAIAYLWKQIGTPCIHLPETHEVVKLFRDLLDLVSPGTLILTETNVPHAENISYFGDGDEAHLVYQFTLPPLLLHALQTGQAGPFRRWVASLEPPPPGCMFLNFTASHDGVGVRPLEGILPEEEIARMAARVIERGGQVSTRAASDGSESPYELNITYVDALAEPGQWGTDLHLERFLCSQTVAIEMCGIPAVYIHSLLGTANDQEGVRVTGRARSINRKRWEEEDILARLGTPDSFHARVFSELVRRLGIRRRQRAFHPRGEQEVIDPGDGVFGLVRTSPDRHERIVCLNNFTEAPREVDLARCDEEEIGEGNLVDLLAPDPDAPVRGTAGVIRLAPYQSAWLKVVP